jgi:hypothetical protein
LGFLYVLEIRSAKLLLIHQAADLISGNAVASKTKTQNINVTIPIDQVQKLKMAYTHSNLSEKKETGNLCSTS